MKNFDSLPFSLNSESLCTWLDTLEPLQPAMAADRLSQALALLEKIKPRARPTLTVLVILTSAVLNASNELCGFNLRKSEQGQTGKSFKFSKLGIHLLKQLSKAFCKLAENPELTSAESHMAIYHALQLYGFCLLNYCLLHDMPSTSLWKQSARLYKLADDKGCLQKPLTPVTVEFKFLTRIEDVLKRNALFHILQPRQFAFEDILELFRLSNRHYDLIDIDTRQAGNFYFYWNLDGEEPGPVKGSNKRLPSGFAAIDCLRFAMALQQGQLKTSLKPATQARLVLHLTAYDTVLNSTRLGVRSSSQLINGLDDICAFLEKYYENQEHERFGTKMSTDIHGRRRRAIQTLNDNGAENAPFTTTFPGKTVSLRTTVGKIFVIAEKCPIDSNIGNLCLLYRQHRQQPTLAIIRQKSLQEISGSTLFLLEYIIGDYTVYYPILGGGDRPALMVNENSGQPEIFLPAGKYSLDRPVNLGDGKIARLLACTEYNSCFCRYRISPDV